MVLNTNKSISQDIFLQSLSKYWGKNCYLHLKNDSSLVTIHICIKKRLSLSIHVVLYISSWPNIIIYYLDIPA